jgi:hypothetical protein
MNGVVLAVNFASSCANGRNISLLSKIQVRLQLLLAVLLVAVSIRQVAPANAQVSGATLSDW